MWVAQYRQSDQVDSLLPPLVQLRLNVRDATKAFIFYEDVEASSDKRESVQTHACKAASSRSKGREGGTGRKDQTTAEALNATSCCPWRRTEEMMGNVVTLVEDTSHLAHTKPNA